MLPCININYILLDLSASPFLNLVILVLNIKDAAKARTLSPRIIGRGGGRGGGRAKGAPISATNLSRDTDIGQWMLN